MATTKKSSTRPKKASAAAAKPNDAHRTGASAAPSNTSATQKRDATMNTKYRILLVDLGERELKRRNELRNRRQYLLSVGKPAQNGDGDTLYPGLQPEQIKELEQIERDLASDVVTDPFYRQVAATHQGFSKWEDLAAEDDFIHKYGLLGSQREFQNALDGRLSGNEREIAAMCGLLQIDGYTDAKRKGFVQKVSQAQGEYRENRELFDQAYEKLRQRYPVKLGTQIDKGLIDADIIGCINPDENPDDRRGGSSDRAEGFQPSRDTIVAALSGRNVAAVVRRLVADKVSANDPWLDSSIQNAYEMQTGVVAGAPASAMEIMLPDLDEATDVEIQRENLHAAQAIYFAYMLEEMRLPQVVERIVELFRAGLLPLGRGSAGDYLYNYYKKSADRITEGERRDLYMRLFGAPGGNPSGNEPNRDFNELWLRFVSAVSSFARQLSVDRLLRTNIPVAVSQEQVRKAGRDLGANLSLHGYGIAYFAATELQSMILEYRDKLSDPEIRGAFGARDMWGVIDLVNANYLGGTRNTHRYRTQARAGAVVIRWLANNHERLTGRFGEVISMAVLADPQQRGSDQPTISPNDWDLVQACEQWLAVGGVQDTSVEQYAQPNESPVIASRPDMQQMARDVMDQAGISLPAM
ncbi:hypothetical protein GCM10027432_26130 [Lysobacter fragariae]